MEEWRTIPSSPNYQVSNLGRVRSFGRTIYDTRGRSYYRPGKARALSVAPNGYVRFNDGRRTISVHCAVLEAFVGPRPNGAHAAHRDGNKLNCALSNLRWATPVENAADKAVHGTAYRPTGERHHMAKLTEATVAAIKSRILSGEKQRHIARALGLDHRHVNSIARGKSWAHVQPQQSDMRAMGRVA